MQSVIAARVKRSKVWAHVTKLASDAICSSVIVNKGDNTSDIMKHLLTKHNIYVLKQCAVFTIQLQLQLARHVHIKCYSAVELHSRDTALIHNHKSTLFACALV